MAGYVFRPGKSLGVHDEIYAKTVLLDDGEDKIVIVSLDLIGFDRNTVIKIREGVKELGINNIILAHSHTHGGPNTLAQPIAQGFDWPLNKEYVNMLPSYIVGSVKQALLNLREAKIGFGKGKVEGITINRRHPDGPTDSELNVAKIESLDGRMMACLVNFTCHPITLGGQNMLFTADYVYYLSELIQKWYEGSVCLFLNGAAGDINPFDWYFGNPNPKYKHSFLTAKRFGSIVGGEVIKVLENIDTTNELNLVMNTKTISLKKRKPPKVEEAERLLKEALKRGNRYNKEKWDEEDHVCHIREKYSLEYDIYFAEQVLGLAKLGSGYIETEISCVKIDDIAMVALPGEIFVELGLDIKKKSGFKNTFVIGYANEYIGYVPTKKAVEESGYLWKDSPANLMYGATLPSSILDENGGEEIKMTALDVLSKL
ncbi:Neutral ceramidase [archaeon HR06]|nr:Neutral ceramidase [archaeon HR06]